MKSNYWVMLLCLLASGFIGCSDDDGDNWKKTFEDEQARIKDFVYSKDSDPKIFKYHYTYLKEDIEDYAYLFNYQKEGKKATYGDFVWINYTQKSLTGSIIDSSDPSVAVGAGVSPYYTLGGPILMQMNTDAEKYIDPLSDILMNIPEGTTGSSIVSSIMSLSSALVYRDYTVESIVEEDNLLDYEKSMIGRYFADNNLDVFKEVPLHEGKTDTVALIAKTKENASGVFVQATDSVTVWAEGRILDELNPSLRQFLKMDSDDVVTWYLPDMIKGISLTLPELKVGEEATILFSSGMGYGYIGSRNYDGTYVVPAYSTLLFKVKIVDTKENPKKDK